MPSQPTVRRTLRVGTRGSPLALFQAQRVAELLHAHDIACEVVVIKTSGDRFADAVLSEIGGKRLFVKEIEDALLGGGVDLAVHSSKDLPAVLPDGLQLGAVLPREDASDAVVLPVHHAGSLPLPELVARLGRGGRIGTSSVRRQAQLRPLFPEAHFLPVRGNLGTRLQKLDEGEQLDALVLASAGLKRLGQGHRISTSLPVETCVPAPGQGIIAVEVRANDAEVLGLVVAFDDDAAASALRAERAIVRRLGGECQMPIGAHARVDGRDLDLTATVLSLDGVRAVRTHANGTVSDADSVGIAAAEQLLELGAGELLAEARNAGAAREPHR